MHSQRTPDVHAQVVDMHITHNIITEYALLAACDKALSYYL